MAHLASLSVEAAPLLGILDDVIQFLVGHLQVPKYEVGSLRRVEALEDVQQAALVVESGGKEGAGGDKPRTIAVCNSFFLKSSSRVNCQN